MVIDMGYWTKVIKRVLLLVFSIVLVFLAFKFAIFYAPFLIAFILSLFIEPVIKFVMRKTKLSRKASAIIVLILVISIIIGVLAWGITSLISEGANLLDGLNEYIEIAYNKVQEIIKNIDFDKIQVSEQVKITIQNSAMNLVSTIAEWVKNGVTAILNVITSIPTMALYVVITILSLYFICSDKVYMLDQMEHHLPKTWVRNIGRHLRELITTLGGYLKAQLTLIGISFTIVLIGLYLMKFMGFNIEYPLLAALGVGFVDALPILGSGTVMVPWAIISAVNGDIKLAIGLITLLVIIMISRQFLEPRIVSKHIGIHPIFTLIAMYTGFKFIGVLGMFVGPIVLIILKNIYGTLLEKGVMKAILGK